MTVFVIMYHNYKWEDNDQRLVKICLTRDIAEKKLKVYNEGIDKFEQEYYIRDYELDIGDLILQENKDSIVIYNE